MGLEKFDEIGSCVVEVGILRMRLSLRLSRGLVSSFRLRKLPEEGVSVSFLADARDVAFQLPRLPLG